MNKKRNKILLVEDEKDYYEIVSYIIKKNFGYDIDWAKDGKEGLDKILKNKYDLIIVDIGLPILNGIEVLKNLKLNKNITPVIIFSVRSELNLIKEALSIGIIGYLIKPFEEEELISKIKNVLKL